MKRLLLVCYHFPPMGGSGVQRPLKWAKYLPRAGWEVDVLSAGHRHYPLQDATLISDIPRGCRVERVPGLEPGGIAARLGALAASVMTAEAATRLEDGCYWRLQRLLQTTGIPEAELLWAPSAFLKAARLCRERPIDAVLTSGPPHASHAIGFCLKRFLGVPWVTDLRDPLIGNWAERDGGLVARRFRRSLETIVARHADRILVTCPEAGAEITRRHPSRSPRTWSFIPNGYDPADAPRASVSRNDRKFRIAHIGSFYRDQTLAPFLSACRNLLRRQPELRGVLEFRAVGPIADSQRAAIKSEDSGFFTHRPYVDHHSALEELTQCDVLLLTTPDSMEGRLCIPGKTFECLAFGGHILAVVHPGTALERILQECGAVTCTNDRHPERIADLMKGLLDAWAIGALPSFRQPSSYDRFQRDAQARELGALLDVCLLAQGRRSNRPSSPDALECFA